MGYESDVERSLMEWAANIVGYSVFIITLIYLGFQWVELPEAVPMQFSFSGDVNRYGSPWEMLILPVLGIMLAAGMEIMERKPHLHNYPLRINDDNRAAFYLNSRRMLNFTKNGTLIILSAVIVEILSSAADGEGVFGFWLIPFILVLAGAPIIYGLIKRSRIQ